MLSAADTRPLVAGILDGRRPPVGAAIAAKRAGADLVELRIDGLSRPDRQAEAVVRLVAEIRRRAGLPIIATFRLRGEGGLEAPGDATAEPERAAVLVAAARAADLVDVEIGATRTAGLVIEAAHGAHHGVILSHHDMTGTPPRRELAAIARKAGRMGGDVLKIAALARSRDDAAELLAFCRECRFPRKIVIAMGPLGAVTRLAGHLLGSTLTYGFLGKQVAPGQFPLRKLVAEVGRYYPGW